MKCSGVDGSMRFSRKLSVLSVVMIVIVCRMFFVCCSFDGSYISSIIVSVYGSMFRNLFVVFDMLNDFMIVGS